MNIATSAINNVALIAFSALIVTGLASGAIFWGKLMLYRLALKKTVEDYLPDDTRKKLLDKLTDGSREGGK